MHNFIAFTAREAAIITSMSAEHKPIEVNKAGLVLEYLLVKGHQRLTRWVAWALVLQMNITITTICILPMLQLLAWKHLGKAIPTQQWQGRRKRMKVPRQYIKAFGKRARKIIQVTAYSSMALSSEKSRQSSRKSSIFARALAGLHQVFYSTILQTGKAASPNH